jgi:hypothetical protein
MKKVFWLIPVGLIFLTVWYYHQWQHWIAYATGSYNTQGTAHNYNAFSGSFSDVGEVTLLFSVITAFTLIWRSHTCNAKWWCWRHPHHTLDGTPYKFCSVHHPDDVPTVKEALATAGGSNGN